MNQQPKEEQIINEPVIQDSTLHEKEIAEIETNENKHDNQLAPTTNIEQLTPEQPQDQYHQYDPNAERNYDQQYTSEGQYDQQQYDSNYPYDPNSEYQTDPNGQYITDPNQQYDQYSYENQRYDEPNQQYPEGMVAQYSNDLNQQFAPESNPSDPNQQFSYSTDQEYSVPPGQAVESESGQQ